jgi:hypothetical protein
MALSINNGESKLILVIALYTTECPQVFHTIKCSSGAINVATICYTVQTVRWRVVFLRAVELAMRHQRCQVRCIRNEPTGAVVINIFSVNTARGRRQACIPKSREILRRPHGRVLTAARVHT